MKLKLFDYTIDEMYEKIFEIEKNKNDFIVDLTETCNAIELLKISNIDEFSIYKINKDLISRRKFLISMIKYFDSIIEIYYEYIEFIKDYFNYNKPHIVYNENAKILELSKYRKDK